MTAWAFVIGINQYPSTSRLNQLRGAVADAAAFADWVLDENGGGVLPENLFLWTCPAPSVPPVGGLADFMATPTPWPMVNPDFTRAPTANEISMAIYLVARNALNAGATRLYVFLAGHGFQTKPVDYQEDPQTCFATNDYHPEFMEMGLVPCDDMMRMLKVEGPPEIVAFFDACRSDASRRVARPTGIWNINSDPGHHIRLAVAKASQPSEPAFEVPHDAPSRGAFSKLLVEGLREHRVNGNLTMDALKNYISSALPSLVKPHNQYPDFQERPTSPPALVLATGASLTGGIELTLDFTPGRIGTDLLLVGGPNNIRETVIGTAVPTVFKLPPGTYVVEDTGGGVLISITHVGPGGTYVTL